MSAGARVGRESGVRGGEERGAGAEVPLILVLRPDFRAVDGLARDVSVENGPRSAEEVGRAQADRLRLLADPVQIGKELIGPAVTMVEIFECGRRIGVILFECLGESVHIDTGSNPEGFSSRSRRGNQEEEMHEPPILIVAQLEIQKPRIHKQRIVAGIEVWQLDVSDDGTSDGEGEVEGALRLTRERGRQGVR